MEIGLLHCERPAISEISPSERCSRLWLARSPQSLPEMGRPCRWIMQFCSGLRQGKNAVSSIKPPQPSRPHVMPVSGRLRSTGVRKLPSTTGSPGARLDSPVGLARHSSLKRIKVDSTTP
jgi:hypothetical protein